MVLYSYITILYKPYITSFVTVYIAISCFHNALLFKLLFTNTIVDL